MKKGKLTLAHFAQELQRQNESKRDFIVDTRSMGFSVYDDGETTVTIMPPTGGTPYKYEMTDLFHRQMGASLGIPAKYYDKMKQDYPDLLAQNINGWFQQTPSKHTIRTMDNTARAFLSDRYRRIDNFDVATATLPVIGEMPDAQIESCEITPNRMYIKVVNPRLEADVVPGDTVQAGIVISNSEVGLGSVTVMPLLYRLVCKNGMIINELGQRKYHIGRENEESYELYSDRTLEADDAAFMLKLQDIVRTAVDEAKFGMVIDKLRETTQIKITGDIPKVVELTAKQYGFNQNEQSGILKHLIEGGDLSLYGLSSAVTRASQDVDDYDRATALESAGWQIVTISPDIWHGVNNGVIS